MLYKIVLDLARWALLRILGRLAAPVVDLYKKDVRRFALGLFLVVLGALGAIVAGLVVAATAAIPGGIVFLLGVVVTVRAVLSACRHAVNHSKQAGRLGVRAITGFRRHGFRSAPGEQLIEPDRLFAPEEFGRGGQD